MESFSQKPGGRQTVKKKNPTWNLLLNEFQKKKKEKKNSLKYEKKRQEQDVLGSSRLNQD